MSDAKCWNCHRDIQYTRSSGWRVVTEDQTGIPCSNHSPFASVKPTDSQAGYTIEEYEAGRAAYEAECVESSRRLRAWPAWAHLPSGGRASWIEAAIAYHTKRQEEKKQPEQSRPICDHHNPVTGKSYVAGYAGDGPYFCVKCLDMCSYIDTANWPVQVTRDRIKLIREHATALKFAPGGAGYAPTIGLCLAEIADELEDLRKQIKETQR